MTGEDFEVPGDIDFGTEETWAQVDDVYGPSRTTPLTLKRLFAEDAETRTRAIRWLYAALFHQGGRFQATARAVPLLFDILEHPALPLPSRRFIFQYLVSLAYGYARELSVADFNPPARLRTYEAEVGDSEEELPAEVELDDYCNPYMGWEIYAAIQVRRTRLYPFVSAPDPSVAAAARTAVALLAADDPNARGAVHRVLEHGLEGGGPGRTGPAEVEPIAAALLAAGTMARIMKLAPPVRLIEPWLQAPDPRLRFIAALALVEAVPFDRLCPALVEGLTQWDDRCDAPAIRDVWSSPVSVAIEAVEHLDLPQPPEWIDALIYNVGSENPGRALRASRSLLRLLSRDLQDRFHGLEASALAPPQRHGLAALLERGQWHLFHFRKLIGDYGLPERREDFSAWLGSRTE